MPDLLPDAVEAAASAVAAATGFDPGDARRVAVAAMEAALPVIGIHGARKILAEKQPCRRCYPSPSSCWTCGRNGAFQRAAAIAFGWEAAAIAQAAGESCA